MAWTYSSTGSTLTTNRDKVRFLCGQTSSVDDVLLHNAEIAYLLTTYSSDVTRTAAGACDALSARYAAQPSAESVGALGLTWGDRAKAYAVRAKELRVQYARTGGISPYVGGISEGDKDIDLADSDVVPHSFRVGMTDNPATDVDTS